MNALVRFAVDRPARSTQRCARRRRVPPIRALRAWLVLLAVFLLAGNAAADTPAAPTYAGGNGTQASPFQIANLAQLRKFMESGIFGGGGFGTDFILTAT